MDVRFINLDRRVDRRRVIERQLARRHLDAQRVRGLDETEGRALLPDSRLTGGELGVLSTWVELLREVAEHGTRGGSEWLLVLEDDVVLAPGFRRRVEAALRQAPPDCEAVQLGATTRYTILPGRAWWKSAVLGASWIVTGRWLPGTARRGGGPHPRFSTDVLMGCFAMAIRTSAAARLADLLASSDLPLDMTLSRAASLEPGRILRHRRQLALHNPFTPSDIEHERGARPNLGWIDLRIVGTSVGRPGALALQSRLARLEARPVDDGLAPGSPGRAVDRLAVWRKVLDEVRHTGARNGARWLVLVDPDSLLGPFFLRQAIETLLAAPDEAYLVQLGGRWPVPPTSREAPNGTISRFARDLAPGTRAAAVRVGTVDALLELLDPWELPLDELLVERGRRHPGRLLRSRRELVVAPPQLGRATAP